MEKMPIGEFKAHCLGIIQKISDSKIPITITKRGKPLARIIPIEDSIEEIYGCMKDNIKVNGDIIYPIEENWEVDE